MRRRLVILASLLALATPALAQAIDPSLDDLMDNAGELSVHESAEDNRAHIEVEHADGGLERTVLTQRGATFLVGERSPGLVDIARIRFTRLVAFDDANGDGLLGDAESVLATRALPSLHWDGAAITQIEDGRRLRALATIPENGAIALSLTATGGFASPMSDSLGIDTARLGVEVARPDGFEDASIALVASLRARGPANEVEWPTSAELDGATVPVTVQQAGSDPRPSDGNRSEVVFLVLG